MVLVPSSRVTIYGHSASIPDFRQAQGHTLAYYRLQPSVPLEKGFHERYHAEITDGIGTKGFQNSDLRILVRVEIKAMEIQNILKNRFGTVPLLIRVYVRFDSTIAGRLVATGNTRYSY